MPSSMSCTSSHHPEEIQLISDEVYILFFMDSSPNQPLVCRMRL